MADHPHIDTWLATDPARRMLVDDEALAVANWPKRSWHCVVLAQGDKPMYGLHGDSKEGILAALEANMCKRLTGVYPYPENIA